MLEDAGFDPAGARGLFAIRARSVVPAREGIELLYEMRRELDMLPAASPTVDEASSVRPPDQSHRRGTEGRGRGGGPDRRVAASDQPQARSQRQVLNDTTRCV